MKKIILFCFGSILLLVSNQSFSQSWLPDPIKSSYVDALSGTWTSEPFVFMGKTNTDVVTYNMILNGQFLEVNFKSGDGNGFSYEGKEILVPSSDGSMKGTYYDIMGKEHPTTYTAKMEGNKIILMSGSPMGKGSREMVIDGNTMVSNVTFRMGDDASLPEQKLTVTYKKSN